VSWVPAEKVVAAVQAQKQVLTAEQSRIAAFENYHAQEKAKFERQRGEALSDLGQAVLPDLTHAAIAKAAETVGLGGLPAENIPAKVEARRAWIRGRREDIARDPRFANREMLCHPRTGSLSRKIAEAEEQRALLLQALKPCDDHLRFYRLMEIGFETPAFGKPWWRLSYWQDRSAAAELVAAMPGATTFDDVRNRYLRTKSDVDVFENELRSLRAEFAASERLTDEDATLAEEQQTLDARSLDHTRRRIVEHLLTADAARVAEHLRTHAKSGLLLLFLRASGITAKINYLEQMQRTKITEIKEEASAQWEKLTAVEARTRKRWAPMPADTFRKLSEDRRPRYEKRWQRLRKNYTTVHDYDRYDRGRYYEQFLWWDLMTRGRLDGSYIHEVSSFHRQNPDYAFDPDWKRLQEEQREANNSGEAHNFAVHGDAAHEGIGTDETADDEAAAAAAELDSSSSTDASVDTTTTDAS
jgi:hypothetical protein